MKMKTNKQLQVKSAISIGNLASDKCYFERNLHNAILGIFGGQWLSEGKLKECLFYSGEAKWWQSFPECENSDQCFNERFYNGS